MSVEAGARWTLTSVWGGKLDGSRDFSMQIWMREPAKWKNAFLLILMNLIMSHDTARVRVCPICGKLFARVRRQEYCSRRCANIASKRAYRARKK